MPMIRFTFCSFGRPAVRQALLEARFVLLASLAEEKPDLAMRYCLSGAHN